MIFRVGHTEMENVVKWAQNTPKVTLCLGRQSTSLPGPRLLGALARLVLAEK